MKGIVLIVFACLLAGCHQQTTAVLKDTIAFQAEKKTEERYTNYKRYYRFQLDPSVSVLSSDDVSSLFDYENNQFSLNINVARIVQEQYYQSKGKSLQQHNFKLIEEFNGQGINNREEEFQYQFQLFEVNDRRLIRLESSEFILEALVQKNNVEDVSEKMMAVLKTAKLKKEEVLDRYSQKYTITNQKKKVDLFKTLLPSTIRLEEVLKNSNDYTNNQDN